MTKMNPNFSILVTLLLVVVLFANLDAGVCRVDGVVPLKRIVGGISKFTGLENSNEIVNLARFAVEEHNKKENSLLQFARVLKVKEQVVAGKLYHLTLEAVDGGKTKIYEAKVWVKPWMNFKQLQEFNRVKSSSPFTSSDVEAVQDAQGSQDLPAHDPEALDAANYAVKTIQQRSNSLLPYELLDILHAKAEVAGNYIHYNLLLKLKRGLNVEKFKVLLRKSSDGKYTLSLMELLH